MMPTMTATTYSHRRFIGWAGVSSSNGEQRIGQRAGRNSGRGGGEGGTRRGEGGTAVKEGGGERVSSVEATEGRGAAQLSVSFSFFNFEKRWGKGGGEEAPQRRRRR